MKKIAIITFTTGSNYGNRLQNYAVQEVIRSLGFDAETISDDIGKYVGLKRTVKHIFAAVYRNFKYLNIGKLTEWERKSTFDKFNKKYIKLSRMNLFDKNQLVRNADEYEYFVVGSDQVWNPYFIDSDNYFLTFSPKEKRIAFSASIGINELPECKLEKYRFLLNEMAYISVREERAAEIISELGLEKPIVLLDPTLILEKEKWDKLAMKSAIKIEREYILCYFLSGYNESQRTYIYNLKNKYSCDIIDPLDFTNREYYSYDPIDFINLIKNAKLVITDSFHGTAFSMIFHTPFVVYNRDCEISMESRLDTLLGKFNLENRKVTEKYTISKADVACMDFEQVDAIINNERKRTYSYLNKALKRGKCSKEGINP